MAKREREAAASSSDDPKPRTKRSKKNIEPDPSSAEACFAAASSETKSKQVEKPPKIKQEAADGDVDAPAAQLQKPVKTPRAGKVSSREKIAKKTTSVPEVPAALAPPLTVAATPVSAVEGLPKPRKTRKSEAIPPPAPPVPVEPEESSEDESSDKDDDESDESSDEDDDDEEEELGAGDSAVVQDQVSAAVSTVQPQEFSKCPGGLHGKADADLYLYNLANLPLTSRVIESSLEEMVYQWLNYSMTLDVIREAFQIPWVVEQLARSSMTPGQVEERIAELSKMLREAPLLKWAAAWFVMRFPDPNERRKVCALAAPPEEPSASTSVPYLRPVDAHKVLLFVVGTPDTPLTDADFDAYTFRRACDEAFGATYIDTVGRWSTNTWRVIFRSLIHGFHNKPIQYRSCMLFPDEAPAMQPAYFVSDIYGLVISDHEAFDCIAPALKSHSGIMLRLEREDRDFLMVHFRKPPGLLRFYAPLPCEGVVKFMPAFKPFHHRGGYCSLCETEHKELVCPFSRTLTPPKPKT